ncbi:hypothetical protein AO726_02700 [Pseudomonas sp. TTU2014-080ASC]|nr:hypothetical protein AO726_02700 [Pseudomonas sp. TTU2014-080ASC]
MPVCNDEIMELSEQLLELGASEAVIRASIGRSYYALYHEALRVATEMGLPEQKVRGGTHEALISRYESQGKRLAVIARLIRRCKLLRVKADYHLDVEMTPKEALVHILQCKEIVADIRNITIKSVKP